MYIRKKTLRYKGKTYENYSLVESVRTPKGPRQKTICSLGNLKSRPREEWLKLAHKVESALVGQEDLFETGDPEVESIVRKVKEKQQKVKEQKGQYETDQQQREKEKREDDLIAVHTNRVRTECHREAGPVHVGYQFWQRLGLEENLKSIGLNERACKLTCAMVLNRLICPSSEHAMPDWIRSTALGEILEIDFEELSDDSLYRNLDRLHPNRAAIESSLAERERNLFNLEQSVFFYDLTSTYFEGQALSNGKARLGYSRDKRPDCKQVVVGLVVGGEGFPLAHEVFNGNSADRETLGKMLDLMNERVRLQEGQTVVVDRAMSDAQNLEEIKKRNLHYIVASRQTERNQWLVDFEDTEDFEEVKSGVKVKMMRTGEQMHVLCLSDLRIEKDRAIRENHEKRLLNDLEKLKKKISKGSLVKESAISESIGRLKERYPRVARYWRIEYDPHAGTFSYQMDQEKRSKAQKLDGTYLLKTDRLDLSAEETWRVYILLTRAEAAFRAMKSPLAMRPIFHQLENRVETHIFLCVLAYHLLISIEKTLLDKGVHISWGTVKEKIKTHQISTVVLPTDRGMTLKIRKSSTPETQHLELYNLLGIPFQIILPKKIWLK